MLPFPTKCIQLKTAPNTVEPTLSPRFCSNNIPALNLGMSAKIRRHPLSLE